MGSNINSEPSFDGFSNRLLQTGLLIDKYYTPLLCLFGALGNSLSLAIFCCNSKHRSQSSSYYLSALAVSDTGFLLNLFAVWLETVYGGVITSDLMCPLVMYLGQVTCFLSIYLMVAFTIERYVAVHYPFSRPSICTRSKAKKVIIAIAAIALVIFSYAWVIAKVVKIPSGNHKNQQVHSMNSLATSKDAQTNGINYVTSSSTAAPTSFDDIDAENNNFPAIIPLSFLIKSRQVGNGNQTSDSLHPTRQLETQYDKFDGSNNTAIKLKNVGEKKSGQVRDHFHLIQDSTLHLGSFDVDASPSLNPENERNILKREKSVSIQQNFSVIITQYAFANQNTTTDSNFRCTVPKHYHKISEIANYLDMVVTLIIPFILITYFNVRIAISVWNLKEQRQQIVASPSVPQKPKTLVVEIAETLHSYSGKSPATTLTTNHIHQLVDDLEHKECQLYTDGNNHAQLSVRFQNKSPSHDGHCSTSFQEYGSQSRLTVIKNNMPTLLAPPKPIIRGGGGGRAPAYHPSSEVRVTKTLLLVSTVFLGLNLPLHAIRCTQFIQSATGTLEGKEFLRALQPWANILFNTNFAVNFFLYCLSGRNFRKSLKHLTSSVFKKTPQMTHLSLAAAQHQRGHENRRRWDNKKWEHEQSSSPPDGEQERTTELNGNNSNFCTSPTITTNVRGPHATEVIELELEDMTNNIN